jgi:hypothetical protein
MGAVKSCASFAALLLGICCGTPSLAKRDIPAAQPDAATAALVAEVRRSFTVHGKPIPPEIFRDFGDGDMADSGRIWVTVDVAAATGSNLYYDPIKQDGGFVAQTKTDPQTNAWEPTSYDFIGSTDNGLLVVVRLQWRRLRRVHDAAYFGSRRGARVCRRRWQSGRQALAR